MKQVIDTYYWKINLDTDKNIEESKYFFDTFLPYWSNQNVLFNIDHNESIETNISISWKNICIHDNWLKWIPNSFVIFLNHLLAKNIFTSWDLMFHWWMIFDDNLSKWKLIIWESWSWKTSNILNLISNYKNMYYLSNTKSIIWNNENISYLTWTNIISVRKGALNYYSKKVLDLLNNWMLYESDDWLYTRPEDKLINWNYNLDWIYNIKFSNKNIYREIINIKEKLLILLWNITHSNIPIVFNENYIYFLNYLEKNNNFKLLRIIAKNIQLYNIEWDSNFITKKIYEL